MPRSGRRQPRWSIHTARAVGLGRPSPVVVDHTRARRSCAFRVASRWASCVLSSSLRPKRADVADRLASLLLRAPGHEDAGCSARSDFSLSVDAQCRSASGVTGAATREKSMQKRPRRDRQGENEKPGRWAGESGPRLGRRSGGGLGVFGGLRSERRGVARWRQIGGSPGR
jgi:hypothetical protein